MPLNATMFVGNLLFFSASLTCCLLPLLYCYTFFSPITAAPQTNTPSKSGVEGRQGGKDVPAVLNSFVGILNLKHAPSWREYARGQVIL